MKNRKYMLFIGLSMLILVMLACTINVGGPAYPDRTIPVSTEAAGDLTFSVQTAMAAGAESGQVTLVITETQLTSYLSYKLQAQSEPLLTDPQVYLQDGQIQIYGTAKQGYFLATVSIIVAAGVDDQGQLTIDVVSANFGPLPVPQATKDAVTAMIKEAYTGAVGPAATGLRITSVTIADGAMTIVGQTK